MIKNTVERWEPQTGLGERPASIFDTTWQGGQQRLLVNLMFATEAGENDGASALIIFHDVFAHQICDEDMDISGLLDSPAAELARSYPYGGRWPFLLVKSSTWVAQLVEQHGGWTAADFRHFIVTSRNMHLHVVCQNFDEPLYIAS
ncbi:MAG: hypothetical protein AAF291_14780 [Pseudomonadota bacterium]